MEEIVWETILNKNNATMTHAHPGRLGVTGASAVSRADQEQEFVLEHVHMALVVAALDQQQKQSNVMKILARSGDHGLNGLAAVPAVVLVARQGKEHASLALPA